ncbi:hypothetical protein O181_011166 [Austropuccinia psidii MF-1]|uniref:Uncharacterized protein n=1 Tax=Austropuccinia psidii MF-1 TaxID=1389203 RepID=A0A9Q3BSD3_9BASI|nr:hypothetical protein [Austropuccinia psidii MF-1]
MFVEIHSEQKTYYQRQNLAQSSPDIISGKISKDPTLPLRFELKRNFQYSPFHCDIYRDEEKDYLSIPVPAIPIIEPSESEFLLANLGQKAYEPVSLEECLKSCKTPPVPRKYGSYC